MERESRYRETLDTWDKLALAYQDKFMSLDLYDDTYAAFLDRLPSADSRLLEIGCGPGNVTAFLLKQCPGLRILATDIAPSMIALASQNVPQAEFKVLDARRIGSLSESFDGILAGFCLPYLAREDVNRLVADSNALLEPGGMIYLSAIEGAYEKSALQTGSTGDSMFVYYYEEAFLRDLLANEGFQSITTFRKGYPRPGGKEEVHLILIAEKTKTSEVTTTSEV